MATKEEIEGIRKGSDLSGEYGVFALDKLTGEPDIAVVKRVVEMDPVYFSSGTNDVQKAKFIYSLEERMIGSGVQEYYFNVKASDTRWHKVIESWGAERVSPTEEFRFKKVLVNNDGN